MHIKKNNFNQGAFLPRVIITSKRRNKPQNFYSINNINYEKEQIMKKKSNPTHINFFKSVSVSQEEYDKSLTTAKELIENFSYELFQDMKNVQKLLSIQKHLMELFNYIVNIEQTFDWNIFKRASYIEQIKAKMENVNYSQISKQQFNFYLNRFTQNEINFPRFIPQSLGMNHLYKWVKCQINIFIYLVNNKLIPNKPEKKSSFISEEDEAKEIRKILNHRSTDILSNNNFKITNSLSSIQSSITKIDECTNTNNDDTLITTIPKSNVISIIQIGKVNKKAKSEKKNSTLSQNSLVLNGINVMEMKKKREEKVLQSLPLVKHKTFGEMRKYFKINKNNEQLVDSKHYYDIQKSGLGGIDNQDKFIFLLSKKKNYILDALPEEKIKQLFE